MRYLLFDADMTIWDFHRTEQISIQAMARKYGFAYSQENLDKYYIGNSWCWQQFEKGLMTIETLEPTRWKLFFEKIGRTDIDENEAGAAFGNLLADNGLLLPGAREFLENVREYPKSLVTNGISRVQHKRLVTTDTEKYFDKVFISQEIGANKPQKAFFDYVLKELGKTNRECLVIGDSETSDIQGALNAGMDSILLSWSGRKSEKATWTATNYQELEELIRAHA